MVLSPWQRCQMLFANERMSLVSTAANRRRPQIVHYYPAWWHHHGEKVQVKSITIEGHYERALLLSGSAAHLTIMPCRRTGRGWSVEWEIIDSAQETTRGVRSFSATQLQAAFGLSDQEDRFGDWLIKQYGADVASQGLYIRWETFLNIPGPGTGHDGDPNISIRITQEMQVAVQRILS